MRLRHQARQAATRSVHWALLWLPALLVLTPAVVIISLRLFGIEIEGDSGPPIP